MKKVQVEAGSPKSELYVGELEWEIVGSGLWRDMQGDYE